MTFASLFFLQKTTSPPFNSVWWLKRVRYIILMEGLVKPRRLPSLITYKFLWKLRIFFLYFFFVCSVWTFFNFYKVVCFWFAWRGGEKSNEHQVCSCGQRINQQEKKKECSKKKHRATNKVCSFFFFLMEFSSPKLKKKLQKWCPPPARLRFTRIFFKAFFFFQINRRKKNNKRNLLLLFVGFPFVFLSFTTVGE